MTSFRKTAVNTKIERDTRCEFTHKRVSLSIFVCGEATDEIDRRSMSTDGTLPIYDAQVGE